MKLLANRLKQVLGKLISENQSAFLKGKLISDNIILAHNLFHHMHTHKGMMNLMTLKLDMSKAYDHVEWASLLNSMENMGFNQKWCGWIRSYISSTSFQVMINGSSG